MRSCRSRRACLRALIAFALALAGACVTAPAGAQLREALRYDYYEVQLGPGRMYPQIRAASPPRKNGETYTGYTTWNMHWNTRWQRAGDGSCRYTSIAIQIDIDISLPRVRGAGAAQAAAFERYLSALHGHELGHAEIVREEARSLERALLALPPARDCDTLRAQGSAIGQSHLQRARERNREYDARTGHGRTQGAVLRE